MLAGGNIAAPSLADINIRGLQGFCQVFFECFVKNPCLAAGRKSREKLISVLPFCRERCIVNNSSQVELYEEMKRLMREKGIVENLDIDK
jgi:hypothetical protein